MPGGYPGEFNAPLPEELGPTESPESISGTSSPLETAQSPEEERQTVADLQALTIEEENLWQMANKWEERLQRVREALPKSVPLAIFKEPEEVRDLAERLVRGETLPADCDLYGDGKSGAAVRAAASDAHASPEGKTVKQAAGEAQECV